VMLGFRCDPRDRLTLWTEIAQAAYSSRHRSCRVIALVARWVLFLGCLLALYYVVVLHPELLRSLLARFHQ
jgi:hypothetical protein